MTRGQVWQLVRRTWITLGVAATVIFVAWSLIAYRASPSARAAIESDSSVTVRHHDGVWQFMPEQRAAGQPITLVFFPGALVDPVAYAPLVRAAAVAGYPAYIVEMPRRGAFVKPDDPMIRTRLQWVLKQPGTGGRWLASGHSRGGVVASGVAADRVRGLAGLVLIGTSHPRDVDLSKLDVPVTKIAGTRDGLATKAKVEENRHKLPASTRLVWIEGGNHSQFGWYGFQPGDRRATISAAKQRESMIRAVLESLAGT